MWWGVIGVDDGRGTNGRILVSIDCVTRLRRLDLSKDKENNLIIGADILLFRENNRENKLFNARLNLTSYW